MAKYAPGEAREWATHELRGVCGCLLPTLRADMSGVNERAIRHDVRREKELGFAGILLVSECGTTPQEMRDVIDIAVAEAGDEIVTVIQAAEPTLQLNIDLIRYAEAAGVDLVLPSYPLAFYPETEQEVYDYTRTIAEASSLGIFIFAVNLWNFGRLHPSDFSPDLIGRLIDDCPNVALVKSESGTPGVAGIGQLFERYRHRVVVTDPFEMNSPVWARNYGMSFMGTSNYEYMGSVVPEYFALLQDEHGYEKAMDIYWRVHPARKANTRVQGEAIAGTNLVHRLMWKYQGWLNGFNGGPIRSPHLRISDGQLAVLRTGAIDSGLSVASESDSEFFVGRHPD
jgi:dihydrodipicolinate synthase/N-acetylneuraminate lyase